MYIFFLDILLCTLNRLQYSVNDFICAGKPKNSFDFIVIFTLLLCSGTELTVSLRCAYNVINLTLTEVSKGLLDPKSAKLRKVSFIIMA